VLLVYPKLVTTDAGIKTEELLPQSSEPQREPSLEVSYPFEFLG